MRLFEVVQSPIYISRPVLNAAEIRQWALEFGFRTTLLLENFHVTLIDSKVYFKPNMPQNTLVIPLSKMEVFYENFGRGWVLRFASSELGKEFQMYRNQGGQPRHRFKPHVTVSYERADNEYNSGSKISIPFDLNLGKPTAEPSVRNLSLPPEF